MAHGDMCRNEHPWRLQGHEADAADHHALCAQNEGTIAHGVRKQVGEARWLLARTQHRPLQVRVGVVGARRMAAEGGPKSREPESASQSSVFDDNREPDLGPPTLEPSHHTTPASATSSPSPPKCAWRRRFGRPRCEAESGQMLGRPHLVFRPIFPRPCSTSYRYPSELPTRSSPHLEAVERGEAPVNAWKSGARVTRKFAPKWAFKAWSWTKSVATGTCVRKEPDVEGHEPVRSTKCCLIPTILWMAHTPDSGLTRAKA